MLFENGNLGFPLIIKNTKTVLFLCSHVGSLMANDANFLPGTYSLCLASVL